MKKLLAAGMILLFLGLYFVVGTGNVFPEESQQVSPIEVRR